MREIRDTVVIQCRHCKHISRVGRGPGIEKGEKIQMHCKKCSDYYGEIVSQDHKVLEIHTP